MKAVFEFRNTETSFLYIKIKIQQCHKYHKIKNVHRTQVKYVNVLTLSSLRSLAGEEISCESTLREEQGVHHAGQYSKFVSVFPTWQRPLLFFNAKVRTNHEFYVRAFVKYIC